MSRKKIDEIIQNLHLADDSILDPNDKFSKVRSLIEKINKKCLLQYLAEQTVSIDELMNLWSHILEGMGVNNL